MCLNSFGFIFIHRSMSFLCMWISSLLNTTYWKLSLVSHKYDLTMYMKIHFQVFNFLFHCFICLFLVPYPSLINVYLQVLMSGSVRHLTLCSFQILSANLNPFRFYKKFVFEHCSVPKYHWAYNTICIHSVHFFCQYW